MPTAIRKCGAENSSQVSPWSAPTKTLATVTSCWVTSLSYFGLMALHRMGSPSGASARGGCQCQPQHSRGTSKPGTGLEMRDSRVLREGCFPVDSKMDGSRWKRIIASPTQPQPHSFPALGLSSSRPSHLLLLLTTQLGPQQAPSTNNTENRLWSRDRRNCKLGEGIHSSFADILCPWRRSCGYSWRCPGSWARHQWSRVTHTLCTLLLRLTDKKYT